MPVDLFEANFCECKAMSAEDDLDAKLKQIDESFSQMLLRKIDEKGMTDAECYKFLFIGANIDAVETAARYGIEKERAVNYYADGEGTRILYESVAKAVCNVRESVPLEASWCEYINADYRRRGK